MKRHLLLRLIVAVLLGCSVTPATLAQQASARIAGLLSADEWFTLADELPRLRGDSLSAQQTLLAEAVLMRKQGRSEQALLLLNRMADGTLGAVDAQAGIDGALLQCRLLTDQGRYDQAADLSHRMGWALLEQGYEGEDTEAFIHLYQYNNLLRHIPPASMERPVGEDVVLPLRRHGLLPVVDVTIHSSTHPFVIATGTPTSFIPLAMVRSLGLRLLPDTVCDPNTGQRVCRAWADSIQVGPLVCRNLVVNVALVDEPTQPSQPLLGTDFLRAAGEVRIGLASKQVVFPATATTNPSGEQNLLLMPTLVRGVRQRETLTFLFATETEKSLMHPRFYLRHKEEFLERSQLVFSVGNAPVTLSQMTVDATPHATLPPGDGTLGMDMMRRFRSVIVNFRDMFVRFE